MKHHCYIGTRKGLFRLDRIDGSWQIGETSFLGVSVPMLLADSAPGLLYAAVEHGHFGIKFHRSKDNGVSWEELPVPTYPEKPEDAPEVLCPMRQTPIPWSLEKIWSLESGGASYPDRLWCGTIPGGLFRSDDRGEHWELVRSLWDRPERAKWFGGGYDYPGIHSISVHPKNNDELTLALSIGGIWKSADSGASWECHGKGMVADYLPPEQADDPIAQDPHRMVHCPAMPNHLWVQHHNGIFYSEDEGRNWRRIFNRNPSDFGFAVAVHPTDPKMAWFVPAVKDEERIPVDGKLVVARTSDGGTSFEAQRSGLPQRHAYDLVYRHGLEIDATGQFLMMGSTSGNVWGSDDLGENWNLVCQHLPPVYCVRFPTGG